MTKIKSGFPPQKKSFKQKSKNWRESHFEWVEKFLEGDDSPLRIDIKTKDRLLRAYNGKLKKEDYVSVINPQGLKGINYQVPNDIQHMPIARPYIDVLVGEELDRRYEWRAILTNPETLSQVEEDRTRKLSDYILRVIQDNSIDEEQAAKLVIKYKRYLKYNYRDAREIQTNQLLRHYEKELDLKLKFNKGFKNVMLYSEEAYLGTVENGRPFIDVIDPKKVFVIRAGSSSRYEDADIILMYDYESPGQILDRYYSYFSDNQVKQLDNILTDIEYGGDSDQERDEYSIKRAQREYMNNAIFTMKDIYGESASNIGLDSSITDDHGNIRVIKLFWKSKKKLLRVKSYDDNGEVSYDYFSEGYIPNSSRGEEVEERWVSQWWEGVKIGKNIYPYIRPRRIQFNKINDPGYNHPGIVGEIYNVNGARATSVMERAMPYQTIYDGTHHKLVDAMSKFFGSLPVVDKADLPDGWDIDKWIFFARKVGIAVKDSFKEGKKGRSTGVLAGGMSGSQNVMNQQGLGDYIQQQLNILSFIEQQMGRVIGVSPQRLGDIQNRETVGGVERSVTQSSFITNEYYKIHDGVKKRVLTLLIELCRIAHRDNPIKFQNISEDFITEIFTMENEYLDEEYGILVDNDIDISKLEQKMDMLAQAGMQNQMLKFTDVMKLYTSSSLAEIQRSIEATEEAMDENIAQERAAQQEQHQQMLQQQQAALEVQSAEKDKELAMKEREHKDTLANARYISDNQELTKRMGIDVNNAALLAKQEENKLKFEAEYDQNEKEMIQKMKDLDEKIRNNKQTEAIAKMALQTQERVASKRATPSKTK